MVKLNINLPDDFLKEEIRCDYKIPTEMKQNWAVMLDLLQELLRVCKKHDIKIFACGGTMLGAVRHQGFIPWDDDVDMMMFREDYDRLCEIAPGEFVYPYFFQTEYTDHGTLRGHAQLRNSLTTGILKTELGKRNFNQGIFIDIFPLDSVTDNEAALEKQGNLAEKYLAKAKKCARWSTRFQNNATGVKHFIKSVVHSCLGHWYEKRELKYYEGFESCCQKYNHVKTERISLLSLQFFNRNFDKCRADFDEIIWVPFEFMQIPIGKNFDHALTFRFGDYHKFVKGGSVHGDVIFSADRPYTEFINGQAKA